MRQDNRLHNGRSFTLCVAQRRRRNKTKTTIESRDANSTNIGVAGRKVIIFSFVCVRVCVHTLFIFLVNEGAINEPVAMAARRWCGGGHVGTICSPLEKFCRRCCGVCHTRRLAVCVCVPVCVPLCVCVCVCVCGPLPQCHMKWLSSVLLQGHRQ